MQSVRSFKAVFAPLSFVILASLAHPAAAGNSDPDASFNGTGVMFRELTTLKNDQGYAIALQADGKVLIGGSALIGGSNRDFGLIRHDASGAPDFGFGDGTGKQLTNFNTSTESINSLVALPGGGVVAAGYTYVGSYAQFALAKYTAGGLPDTAFGAGSGKVQSNFSALGSIARGVALQTDGKYVVVGESFDPSNITKNDFIVARYNADGTLDTSFGVAGTRRIPVSSNNNDAGFGIAIQPDGRIVVAGDYNSGTAFGAAVVRLTANGNLDATFGTAGKVLFTKTGLNIWGRAVAVQPDGKIVVAASATITSTNTSILQIIRFTPSGSLDASFNGGAGYISHGVGAGLVPSYSAVELLPTGEILASGRGYITMQNAYFFMTARYTAAGVQDATYNGGAGYKLGDAASVSTLSLASGIGLQPDGKFIAAGQSANKFAAVRYQGDALDTTPNAATFTDAVNVTASTLQISDVITVSGLTSGAMVPMTVTGGNYSINGNPVTSDMGYVKNGDMVMVSHTSAAGSGASVTTTLKIGGLHAANNRALVLGAPTTATFTSTTQ